VCRRLLALNVFIARFIAARKKIGTEKNDNKKQEEDRTKQMHRPVSFF